MLMLLLLMTGIMAGLYFAFSVFIMRALANLPPDQGAGSMVEINRVITRTAFLPLFFISSIGHVLLLFWAYLYTEGSEQLYLIGAALLYIGGMFIVTVFGNVPLNKQLEASARKPQNLQASWQHYLQRWQPLNHLRTVSCSLSMVLIGIAGSPAQLF